MKSRFNFNSNNTLKIFITIGTILTGIFLIGYVFNQDLYYAVLQGDRYDTFMDFFNSVSHAIGRDPYGIQAIYPPLCYVLYWILGMSMGNSAMELLEQNQTRQLALKALSQPMMVYWVYFVVSFMIFIYLSYRLVKGNKNEKICFLILITISVPFMFQFERANIIFIALLGTMAFFVWKDSENQYLREFAMICLALSAALKIYPAIFGLVLIKEKRYKDVSHLLIYGLICFFLPFLFIRGGFHNIPQFIKNLIYTSTIDSAQRDGYKLNYSALFSFVIDKFANNTLLAEQIGSKISIGIAILGVCVLPWLQKSWKSILLLTCLLVGVPNMSYTYTAIFFVIPLICFCNDPNIVKGKWIFLVLFLLIFFPLPIGWNEHLEIEAYYIFKRSFNTLQISIVVLLITINLIGEGVFNFLKQEKTHLCLRRISALIGILVLIFSLILAGRHSYHQAMTNKAQEYTVEIKTLKDNTIFFNGNEYIGTYTGETINNKPDGYGTFTFTKHQRGLKLLAQWKENSIQGKVQIIYPNGTYDIALCENGQVYGNVISYSESDTEMKRDWYYNSQKLSDIQKSAEETDFENMKFINTLYPGTVFRCQGEVTKVTQRALWIEVTVKDNVGGEYLFEYYNSVFDVRNPIKVPNIKERDNIICYGKLNGKDTKNVLGMDLISAELANDYNPVSTRYNYSYNSILRYPYNYIGDTMELHGSVKEISRNFETDSLVYTIDYNNELYALVFGLNDIFSKGYSLPYEEKAKIMTGLEETLPRIGEDIDFTGIYKGNYIWEDTEQDMYKLRPYIFVSVKINDEKEYIFEEYTVNHGY